MLRGVDDLQFLFVEFLLFCLRCQDLLLDTRNGEEICSQILLTLQRLVLGLFNHVLGLVDLILVPLPYRLHILFSSIRLVLDVLLLPLDFFLQLVLLKYQIVIGCFLRLIGDLGSLQQSRELLSDLRSLSLPVDSRLVFELGCIHFPLQLARSVVEIVGVLDRVVNRVVEVLHHLVHNGVLLLVDGLAAEVVVEGLGSVLEVHGDVLLGHGTDGSYRNIIVVRCSKLECYNDFLLL